MAVVDVGEVSVGYDVTGSGPPLVLLHGAVCDRRVWRELVELLADDFTVVAVDIPGCGESGDPPTAWELADYATCLAGLLEALGTSPAHVVGHSWGGGLALQLALDHPHLVRSQVLLGGYAGWKGSLPADEVERRLAKALEVAERLPDGFDPRMIPGLFSDRISPARTRELAEVMADIRPAGTRAMAIVFAEADLRDRLGEVAVPTLLLNGTEDVRATPEVAEQLRAGIASSTLVMLPELGHEAFAEAPDLVATAVRDFLLAAGQDH